MIELSGNAERAAQVEVADPEAVDAVDGGDGFGVAHALGGLDLGEEGGSGVLRGQFLAGRPLGVAVQRGAQDHAAVAARGVLHAPDDPLCLFGRRNHGQHHALGPGVAGAGDVLVVLGGHPHDGRQIGRLEEAEHAFGGLDAEADVLGVQDDELAARALADAAHAGGVELEDEVPRLEGAGSGHGLESRFGHPCPPWVF